MAAAHAAVAWALRWDDGLNYYGRGGTTRDQYAGIMFGLLAALEFVGPDDLALQALLRDDVMTMTDYLVRHAWWVVYPQASRTNSNPLPYVSDHNRRRSPE